MEKLLGNPDNPRMIPVGAHHFNWIFADACNKWGTNESLPLNYSRLAPSVVHETAQPALATWVQIAWTP